MAATGQRVDPYKNFRFLVEIEGIVQAGFSEASGFGSDVEVVEYREGGDTPTVRKLPGQGKYPDVTLKWGITDSRELYDWHRARSTGRSTREERLDPSCSTTSGQEKVRWNFYRRLAEQVGRADFNAKGNEVAIDTLEL